LKKALHFRGYSTDLLQKIEYGYNGKPYILNWQSFSISHAKNYVVLAFGTNQEIGIDIEFHKERLPTKNMLSFLLPTEQNFIEKSSNPKAAFFIIWTRKEAFSKRQAKAQQTDIKNVTIPKSPHNTPGTFTTSPSPQITHVISLFNSHKSK